MLVAIRTRVRSAAPALPAEPVAPSKTAQALIDLADEAISASGHAAHDQAGPMERKYAQETRAELFRPIEHTHPPVAPLLMDAWRPTNDCTILKQRLFTQTDVLYSVRPTE